VAEYVEAMSSLGYDREQMLQFIRDYEEDKKI
jgi:hypothetical protein